MDTINPNMIVQKPHKSPLGPVLVIIIVLALILIGAFFFWGEPEPVEEPLQSTPTPTSQIEGTGDEQADEYLKVSDSDETTSIEADLNNTDFSNIDAGIEELE